MALRGYAGVMRGLGYRPKMVQGGNCNKLVWCAARQLWDLAPSSPLSDPLEKIFKFKNGMRGGVCPTEISSSSDKMGNKWSITRSAQYDYREW